MISIAIIGAGGRMGQRIAALAIENGHDIVSAVEMDGHPALGRDVGDVAGVGALGLTIETELSGFPDVVIDFSLPEGTMKLDSSCGSPMRTCR